MKNFFTSLLLLTALFHLPRGDSQHEQYMCHPLSVADTDALNIGQNWGTAEPTATTQIDLLKVTSPSSYFDFRTFDPEGVIFYGDTLYGKEWFLLGLRNGRPEIQVRNSISQISVSGCNRINDGEWHRISVKSEDKSIVLNVDDAEALRIWHASTLANNNMDIADTTLRISVGGILTNLTNLLVPMNPAMDGCIRFWNWMNQTTAQLTSPSVDWATRKPCFERVQRGSLFAGDGMAAFSSRDFWHGDECKSKTWNLSLEMTIRPSKRTGFLFAISASKAKPALSLRMEEQTFNLEVGTTILQLPFPSKLCLVLRLTLQISKDRVSWGLDENKVEEPMLAKDYQALRESWQDEHGQVFIGGVPDLTKLYPSKSMVFFEGCLQEIQLQGQFLDMDSAKYKSDSIWAHSCPSSNFFSNPLPKETKD